MCSKFLRGICNDKLCKLSHQPTPEKVPLCLFFSQRGGCKNETDCPYLHVSLPPDAPICRAFAKNGYCKDGKDCKKQHLFTCPDFVETGTCPAEKLKRKCRLFHPPVTFKGKNIANGNLGTLDEQDEALLLLQVTPNFDLESEDEAVLSNDDNEDSSSEEEEEEDDDDTLEEEEDLLVVYDDYEQDASDE